MTENCTITLSSGNNIVLPVKTGEYFLITKQEKIINVSGKVSNNLIYSAVGKSSTLLYKKYLSSILESIISYPTHNKVIK